MSDNAVTLSPELNLRIESYVSAPFVRMLVPDADEGGFIAEVLELPGCISEGETAEEAYDNLDDAMRGWIAASLKNNTPIPAPVGEREYSGHLPLRMSSELHRLAALRATHEGVSLNQWLVAAIAARLSGESLADQVVAKLAMKMTMEATFRFESAPVSSATGQAYVRGPNVTVPASGLSRSATPQEVLRLVKK